MRKLILINGLSPGDILIMSCAIRDLKKAHPDFLIDVRSPCNEIFRNNPYITPISDSDPEAENIQMEYPLIHSSGFTGTHFSDGYRVFLEDRLKIKIPKTSMRPDIYLSQDELLWPNPVFIETGYEGKYWLINAGIKDDYTLKQYPYFQEVVNLLKGKIQFVQIGLKVATHFHKPLENVIDMVGKTDSLRTLFRISYHAEGAICAVSLQMVIMQALFKPCVIVAGGREGMRWQAINDHVFLHTNGLLNCCKEDGCWRSVLTGPNPEKACLNVVNNVAKCMAMIKPERIAQAVLDYYEGGRL